MDDFRAIADVVAADIAAGRLRPGDRLPPQRGFARRHGIANSTAVRVYSELIRRGLVVGEVGRGSFVRAASPAAEPALAEPGQALVDLELNFSVLPEQPGLLAASLQRLLRPDVLAAALKPATVHGNATARAATAELLARAGWTPNPAEILFTGNGRQAIAAAIAALVPVGGRLGVEAITYPVVKGIATRLGITLVPLAMDASGVLPDALRPARVQAVYLQPTLHNPLGTTMPAARRAEIAETVRKLDIRVIEDSIYAFLADESPPLAPERTIVVDSLSKRLAPGLTVGFAVTPPDLREKVATAIRSGGWAAQHFPVQAATCWLGDGTAAKIVAAKRADALARQRIARATLNGLEGDERAYHCWWNLPEPWRAETFVAAAARRGIAVAPAAAFAVVPGHAPNAVRLALAAPPRPTLVTALETLAEIARHTPEDTGVE
ncbi:MAG: PLP-dependent aminotransferase family protein [Kibdelosporangium sp.]